MGMTTARVTVTLPTDLHQAAQHAAHSAGVPFSAVVSDALAAWVRGQLVDAWLAEHQATHGPFGEDEQHQEMLDWLGLDDASVFDPGAVATDDLEEELALSSASR